MKVTEEEIRPEKVFDEYLRLTAADTITYFSDVEQIEISCPACGGKGQDWAKKSLFSYQNSYVRLKKILYTTKIVMGTKNHILKMIIFLYIPSPLVPAPLKFY